MYVLWDAYFEYDDNNMISLDFLFIFASTSVLVVLSYSAYCITSAHQHSSRYFVFCSRFRNTILTTTMHQHDKILWMIIFPIQNPSKNINSIYTIWAATLKVLQVQIFFALYVTVNRFAKCFKFEDRKRIGALIVSYSQLANHRSCMSRFIPWKKRIGGWFILQSDWVTWCLKHFDSQIFVIEDYFLIS